MFNNELMADVKFVVGCDGKSPRACPAQSRDLGHSPRKLIYLSDNIQTIPAHKYILATGSSVFYAMFYGGLAENKQEIKVPDVEPSAFLTLLK